MLHKLIHSLLIALLCLPLSGCWNRRELNELAITVGMAIDKVGKEYIISAQVVEPGEVASTKGVNKRTPVTLYKEKNTSVMEAIREMTTETPRRIYLAHLRMLVISEQLAKDGIAEVLDFFSRSHELRNDFFIVISRGNRAQQIMEVLTPLESLPSMSMFTSLETSSKSWAPTTAVVLDELINELVSNKSLVLTGLKIKGDTKYIDSQKNVRAIDPPMNLQYSGLAVFSKDKLVGWLNENQSKGYNYIQGRVVSTVGHSKCPNGGKIITEVVRTK